MTQTVTLPSGKNVYAPGIEPGETLNCLFVLPPGKFGSGHITVSNAGSLSGLLSLLDPSGNKVPGKAANVGGVTCTINTWTGPNNPDPDGRYIVQLDTPGQYTGVFVLNQGPPPGPYGMQCDYAAPQHDAGGDTGGPHRRT